MNSPPAALLLDVFSAAPARRPLRSLGALWLRAAAVPQQLAQAQHEALLEDARRNEAQLVLGACAGQHSLALRTFEEAVSERAYAWETSAKKRERYLKGGGKLHHIEGNAGADALAKRGANMHSINHTRHYLAQARVRIAGPRGPGEFLGQAAFSVRGSPAAFIVLSERCFFGAVEPRNLCFAAGSQLLAVLAWKHCLGKQRCAGKRGWISGGAQGRGAPHGLWKNR